MTRIAVASPTMIALALLAGGALAAAPEAAPSYKGTMRGFFTKYCVECHNADESKGGLNLESYASLKEGGDRGIELLPGKPDESRLVLVLEGKVKPHMPPKKATRRPSAAEIARVRLWVAGGAKLDGPVIRPATTPALPDIRPVKPVAGRIAALAYRPDGKLLAAGGYREVILLHAAGGAPLARLPQPGPVTALAFSRDGRTLDVASGAPGQAGIVQIYRLSSTSAAPSPVPAHTIAAHADLIYALDVSPDGKVLATAGYDRLIKLWDNSTAAALKTLKDHSDTVYGLAFSPDGTLLASAAADRSVKVWDVKTGKRLYTLSEPTDWVYAVAWSPAGQLLAAGGIDKSIRIWNATAQAGHLVRTGFAHDRAVLRLVYAADGKTLYSLGEDRIVKAWDADRLVERRVFEKQPDATLALALNPSGTSLAIGRFDGRVIVYEAGGAGRRELLPPPAPRGPLAAPAKPRPVVLAAVEPRGAGRGTKVRLTFRGQNVADATGVIFSTPGLSGQVAADAGAKDPNTLAVDLAVAPDAAPGVYQVWLKTPHAETARLPFAVDPFATVAEAEPNDVPMTAQPIELPATVVGALDHNGDVDVFRFHAAAGQQVAVELVAKPLGSKLEPVIALEDEAGHTLAESTRPTLGYSCGRGGTYYVLVRDIDYRGGSALFYRLNIGGFPVITDVFPLGLRRGSKTTVHLGGVNLGAARTLTVEAPPAAAPGTRIPLPLPPDRAGRTPVDSLVVGKYPEAVEVEPNDRPPAATRVPTPCTINGRIDHPGDVDLFRFTARQGQTLILDVDARRLGSPLDSVIEVLDLSGRPIPRATLRCVAKTASTFRDHDAVGSTIRMESWSEFAINDMVLVGNELLKMKALPKTPDDDARFFDRGGARMGFLDTTPSFISLGMPMYKVHVYPPGARFPSNGMPVVTIFYRNDDGGPHYGKDSRLFFTPPADGAYLVRISDVQGHGGPQYAYRLAIRPPEPSYTLSVNPAGPSVARGGAVPVTISADRTDGFEGPIEVTFKDLPAGFSAPPTTIPAGEDSTALALYAAADAAAPATGQPPLKVIGRAWIDGKAVVREAAGGVPKPVPAGDLVCTTEQSEVAVQPGHQIGVTVKIERRNNFKGRVPIEVRGLPHGCHVLDIGLNGILIVEGETTRSFVIYAEPWATPMIHPFVVSARREGTGGEAAARSVLLKVQPPAQTARK